MAKSQHEEAEAAGPGLRSTGTSSFKDVEQVLSLAAGMVPEADEFAALRNCFTK